MNRVRGLAARTPLRISLVVALVLLLAFGLIVAGVAATASLRGYLLERIDASLIDVSRGFAERPAPSGTTPLPPQGGAEPGRLAPSELYVAYFDDTGATTAVLASPFGTPATVPALPSWSVAEVAANGAVPFSVGSQPAGETWRVVARPMLTGSGSVMVAQSQVAVEATVRQLVVVQLVVGAIVVLGLALLSFLVIRRSLRPLTDVEHAAESIAAGDLSRRAPESSSERTEVGSLARSFNRMAAGVQAAFAAQEASEAAARASATAARDSEQRMRRFVADASHELRTPLTSIRGFSELYRQGALSDEEGVSRAMSRIEGESTRMAMLVEDLLTLARLDRGREPQSAPVDLLVLAGDAVHDARAVAPQRRIDLEVVAGDRPPVVTGDEPGLRQVLANMMSNALRYSPNDQPVLVRLTTRPAADGAVGWAVLEVVDHGPGLSPAAAARVFERFYRTDDARSRDQGGTGLGLAIVDAVVTAHGGRVEVDSTPGHGATFRVLLPLAA